MACGGLGPGWAGGAGPSAAGAQNCSRSARADGNTANWGPPSISAVTRALIPVSTSWRVSSGWAIQTFGRCRLW